MALLGRRPEDELTPSERRYLKLRHHWAVNLPVLVQTMVGVSVAYLLARISDPDFWLWQSLLWYGAWALLIRCAWKLLDWWHVVLLITDKRFVYVTGTLRQDSATLPINKVTDLAFKQSLGERMLRAGNLRIESAGQVQDLEHLRWLPHFNAVKDAINELVYGERSEVAPRGAPRRRGRRRKTA